MTVSMDVVGAHELVASLGRVSATITVATRAVVERGGFNIKKAWAENARASSGVHAPHYPASISYDMHGLLVEVGPDKGRTQGPLGNLLEYGSTNSPPHWDGQRAMDDEAPKFERALGDMLDGLL